MDRDKLLGMLWGAYVADAYALGAHWMYNVDEIKDSALTYEGFNDPLTEYHNTKKAGEFTHYGDQSLWLLESIALENQFALSTFSERWKKYMIEYNGYLDGASSATLLGLRDGKGVLGCGSTSKDLSVIGRMAPLIYKYSENMDKLIENVKLHTVFTHMTKELVQGGGYFTEIVIAMLLGVDLESAFESSTQGYDEKIQNWVKVGLLSKDYETNVAIKDFGQSCSVENGFPGVIHLVSKYADDYKGAMIANVQAGGDSAARGMIVGMILGAKNGLDAVPQAWRDALTHNADIKNLVAMIDAQKS